MWLLPNCTESTYFPEHLCTISVPRSYPSQAGWSCPKSRPHSTMLPHGSCWMSLQALPLIPATSVNVVSAIGLGVQARGGAGARQPQGGPPSPPQCPGTAETVDSLRLLACSLSWTFCEVALWLACSVAVLLPAGLVTSLISLASGNWE